MTTKYFNVKNGMTTGNVLVSEANVTLGNVANLHISGGNSGYLLRTDGSSNLTWVDPAATQSAAPMPIVVDAGNTLTIAANYQGLFGTTMTINGTLEIDGALIDVSGQGAPGSNAQITFNDQGNPAGNNGFLFNKTNGQLSVPGNINVSGSIVPTANVTYDLGNNTNRFRDLYLSGNTIDLGGAVITANSTSIVFTNPAGGNFVVTGDGNSSTSEISNGSSNIQVLHNSNVVISATGTSNVFLVSSAGILVNGVSNLGPVSNVKITGGSNGQVLTTDGTGILSWTTVSGGGNGNGISNGTSNIVIDSNGNIRFSVAGYGDRFIFADDRANFKGNLIVEASIQAGNANLGNAATANFFIGNLVGMADTANIANTANSVNGNNVVGAVANATHALTANTVTDNAHPNITSVGTLVSLAVTGNIQSANHLVSNNFTSNANAITISAAGTDQNVNLRPTGIGTVDVGNFRISNIAAPINGADAATKDYVDSLSQGLHTHDSCNAATNTTLAIISGGTVTYDNGTSGVGATLTTTGSYTTIDGVTLSNGMRILVKNEANAAHNGIYTRTSSTVLTRAVDFNTSVEMAGGDFTFVTAGTLYDSSGWVMSDPVTTVGTTPVNWTQFSGSGTYTAGDGLSLNGTQFSVNTALPNLTSIGTLANLTVTGNVTVGNLIGAIDAGSNTITTTGNITAANLIGNFANGNTTVSIPIANGNLAISVAGNSNVVLISGNSLTVIGNITSNGGIFTGNGSGLSNINGPNVNGSVANASYAATSGSATTSINVTANSQPNITSVGTLSNLVVSGNANVGTLHTDTIKYANGNPYQFTTNAGGANTQVQFNDGNIFGGSANFTFDKTTNTLSVTNLSASSLSGNGSSLSAITGANVTGTVANATYATSAGSATTATTAGTVTTNAQPNITSIGTLSTLSVSGNANVGNIGATNGVFTNVSGNGSALTSLTGANVTGTVANAAYATSAGSATTATSATSATTAGTVTTAAQPNITSVGTLSTLSVTGNANVGNIGATNGVFTNVSGNGSALTAIPGANVTGTVSSATTAGTVTTAAQPNITSVGTLTSATVTSNVVAGNVYANSGTVGASLLTGTLTTAAQPNVTSVGTLSSLSVTGNVAAGNLTTTGVLSVTGTGVSSIGGNLDMTSNNITNLAEPVNASDAATKNYVDNVAQGLHIHPSCNAATTTTLASISGGTVTYNNGTSGVGATLTTTGSYTTIDGVTLSNSMRILVKNETNTAHNGIYVRTSSTVLTRADDFNTATEIAGGDFTFVTAGTLYNSTGWVNEDEVTTVGTDPIVFTQFSGSGTYSAGTGLTLTGSTFSVNASQTQITSVGTLSGLGVNGTITGVNITANTGVFTGNGSGLSAIAGANVTGTVSSATTAGTVTTAAQPNITSTGTLTSLGVSGNITAANITANTGVFTGNGSGLSALNASNISSGTLAQARLANSSLTINGTSISLGGSGTVTANTTQTLTLGSFLTGTSFNGGTAVTAAVDATSANTASKVVARDASGNFSAGTITATLSGAATTAGTVTTAAQPNITSVGTLTGLTVSGNSQLPVVALNRVGGAGTGISWYSLSTYNTWAMYMAQAAQTSCGPTANITAPTGNLVTSWGLRSFIENGAGYGWTFESATNGSQPSVVAEIRSSDGSFRSAGNIFAVGDVVTNYSDERLKDVQGSIENALEKVCNINTFYYRPNELAKSMGVADELQVGVGAGSVEKVASETVKPSPLHPEYKTVMYERLVPYLIEAIKEQNQLIKGLQEQINQLKGE